MFGLPFSALVNIAQTVGALGGAWLVQRGYMSGDTVQQTFGAIGTLALIGFNIVNHQGALAVQPPKAVATPGKDATA